MQELRAAYDTMFPGTQYVFAAGTASTGMYRGIRLWEQAVIATNGDLARDAVSEAMNGAAIANGPGGPARVVAGTGHVQMNMYIAQSKGGKFEIISEEKDVLPQECL